MVQYELRKDYSSWQNNLPWTPAGPWNHCMGCVNTHARQAQAGCGTRTIRLKIQSLQPDLQLPIAAEQLHPFREMAQYVCNK
jgi:hypothetical protein